MPPSRCRKWVFAVVVALAGCARSPVSYRPMGMHTLREHQPLPVAAGVTGVKPVAGGAGSAPVRGIEFREIYLDEIKGPARPYSMDVWRWSEEFRDSLVSELRRVGVSTNTGPLVHVEVRTLDVDSPFAFGASTCRLEANLFVQGPNVVQVYPVVADGRAEKDHTCIGNAFAAMVRHIVASPWLATTSGGPSTVPTSTERAKLLPNTDGRYGLQFSMQLGAGAVRLVGGGSASFELGPAFGIALDLPIRQNFFFTGSVQGERAAGALGIGFSHYVASSFLISYSFLAGGDNGSEGTELRVPALGGQVMLGKQWQVSSSFWLGFAVRPWAMWSLDEGRGYGASLFSTVTIN